MSYREFEDTVNPLYISEHLSLADTSIMDIYLVLDLFNLMFTELLKTRPPYFIEKNISYISMNTRSNEEVGKY